MEDLMWEDGLKGGDGEGDADRHVGQADACQAAHRHLHTAATF